MLRLTAVLANYVSLEQVRNIVNGKLAGAESMRDYMLVDVRSTAETARTGVIPTAVNIPLSILEEVLEGGPGADAQKPNKSAEDSQDYGALSDEEYRYFFGAERPVRSTTRLVFYCAHGVRSAVAAEVAEQLGYTGALNFSGSWAEWYHAHSDDRAAVCQAKPPPLSTSPPDTAERRQPIV